MHGAGQTIYVGKRKLPAAHPRNLQCGLGLIKAHLVSALAAENQSREYLGADMAVSA